MELSRKKKKKNMKENMGKRREIPRAQCWVLKSSSYVSETVSD